MGDEGEEVREWGVRVRRCVGGVNSECVEVGNT